MWDRHTAVNTVHISSHLVFTQLSLSSHNNILYIIYVILKYYKLQVRERQHATMSTMQTTGTQPTRPSKVAEEKADFDEGRKSFFKALFKPTRRDGSVEPADKQPAECIQLDNAKNMFDTDSLIIRPCYEHLLPQIHNKLLRKQYVNSQIAVTGTPGIGKSVFGVILVRYYVLRGETVVYFRDDQIFVFSFDREVISFFGLSEFDEVKGSMCYAGYWKTESSPRYAALVTSSHLDKVVIHDPKMGDDRVRQESDIINRLVYILSHGHTLISHWNDKGSTPDKYYLPLWSKEEAERCLTLLKIQRSEPSSQPLQAEQVGEKCHKFGGCIRGWVVPDPDDFQETLYAKVREVVNNNGSNVLIKNTSVRGSIIHLHVDFDERRPIVRFDGDGNEGDDDNMLVDSAATESEGNRAEAKTAGSEVENVPNDFTAFEYVFGSDDILNQFDQELLNRSDDALALCVNNWSPPTGGLEGVYGALYELR